MAKTSASSRSKKPTKKPATKPKLAAAKAPLAAHRPRRLKRGNYSSFRLSKRIKHPVILPTAWKLTKASAILLWQHKKLFIGIAVVYGLLNALLVQGFAGTGDLTTLKQSFQSVVGGHFSTLGSSLYVFLFLVGSSGNSSNSTAGSYQLVLAVMVSLAVIWALRQVLAGSKIRIRDAYYRGMYPFVPFILVLCVVGLQLLPMLIGYTIYNLVISNGIAVYGVEKLLWAIFFGASVILSLYMLSSSLFALYVVTLPDMTPMKALRSARELVRYRRWTVIRKILALPVILFLAAALIMVPIIIFLTPLAQWVFFFLTMFGVVALHTYMYSLYRELLREQN